MRDRGMQDQEARRRGVVQVRPGQLDLFQLAQTVRAEVVNSALVAGLVRVWAELTVNLLPGEPLWSCQSKDSIGEPQVEIEAQRRAFECLEGGEIEWHRMAHNLIKE